LAAAGWATLAASAIQLDNTPNRVSTLLGARPAAVPRALVVIVVIVRRIC
jgi:hypothetical protein